MNAIYDRKLLADWRSAIFVGLNLLLVGSCFAEETERDTEPAVKTNSSAGIVNDWLRERYAAAAAWDIGGQFRIRPEARDAGSFPNRDFARDAGGKNEYFLLRTRIHLGWAPVKWFTAYIEGRDAHAISDSRAVPESDRFDLYQAHLRLGNKAKFPIAIKIGRQELIYGEQRYIGNGDWSNYGRSFDSVKLRFENDAFWLDAFIGRPVVVKDGSFNRANQREVFGGLYASTRRLIQWQESDFYFLAHNVGIASGVPAGQGGRDIYTMGIRWKSLKEKFGLWDYAFELAGQFGSVRQGKRLKHRGLAMNGALGRTWRNGFGSPRLALGYDFGSGDNNPGDDRNETFYLLFGSQHRFYGNMDLAGLRNMHIPRVEAELKLLKAVTVSVEWHGFWLANPADFFYAENGTARTQNGYGSNPGLGSHVGQEIDLLLDWHVTKWGQVRAGYGHFFIGDYIRRSLSSIPANGGATGVDWLYVQLTGSF